MRKVFLMSVLTLIVSMFGFVGIPEIAEAGLTHFSRANCINNESISWDPTGQPEWLWVNSYHLDPFTNTWHCEDDRGTGCFANDWEWASHNGGIHWGEGVSGGYRVLGYHWYAPTAASSVRFRQTSATGC